MQNLWHLERKRFNHWKRISSLIFLLLISCKTREDLAREKVVDTLAIQFKENQKMSSDITVKVQEFEEKVSQLSGKIEEAEHSLKSSSLDRVKATEERLKVIEIKMKDFESYIVEVNNTLKNLGGGKKSKKISDFQQALNYYRTKKI